MLLYVLLAGCAVQDTERQPEPFETTEENGTEGYSEPIESSNFDDAEYLAEQEQLQAEIESLSSNANLPIWANVSDDIPYGSYTIEYQRELPGRSFVGYTGYFDIIEKNNQIFISADEWEAGSAVMYIEITEEQLQLMLTTDNFNGFIYSFTVTSVCYFDMGIDAEREENENNDTYLLTAFLVTY